MPVAVESAMTGHGPVVKGQEYDRSDPRVESYPRFFEPVETATSAPGETRSVELPDDSFVCDVCEKVYSSEGWLDRHVAEKHGDD